MQIYGDLASGDCLKIKIVAGHLGLACEWVQIDALKGETRTSAYLALFPAGQIPGVAFNDGRRLAQSNAIIRYLARDTALMPRDPFEPTIAVCRAQVKFRGLPLGDRDPALVVRGEAAPDLMERHLAACDWMVGESVTVADIALYAYTQWAGEGGFALDAKPAIRAWLARCADAFRKPYGPTDGPSGDGADG